jgi:hypothetical protein
MKMSLCQNKKAWRVKELCPIVTSVLDSDEWSAPRSGNFNPRGKGPRFPLDMLLVFGSLDYTISSSVV